MRAAQKIDNYFEVVFDELRRKTIKQVFINGTTCTILLEGSLIFPPPQTPDTRETLQGEKKKFHSMCEACHVVMKTKSLVVTLTVFYFKNISRYAFTLDLFDLM